MADRKKSYAAPFLRRIESPNSIDAETLQWTFAFVSLLNDWVVLNRSLGLPPLRRRTSTSIAR
jgi:hypothetical protein